MNIYVCSYCDCVDAVELNFPNGVPTEPTEQLCALCRTGRWHGQFPRAVYDPEVDRPVNRPTGIGLG